MMNLILKCATSTLAVFGKVKGSGEEEHPYSFSGTVSWDVSWSGKLAGCGSDSGYGDNSKAGREKLPCSSK